MKKAGLNRANETHKNKNSLTTVRNRVQEPRLAVRGLVEMLGTVVHICTALASFPCNQNSLLTNELTNSLKQGPS
jgi:hypothetical protein